MGCIHKMILKHCCFGGTILFNTLLCPIRVHLACGRCLPRLGSAVSSGEVCFRNASCDDSRALFIQICGHARLYTFISIKFVPLAGELACLSSQRSLEVLVSYSGSRRARDLGRSGRCCAWIGWWGAGSVAHCLVEKSGCLFGVVFCLQFFSSCDDSHIIFNE